MPVPSQTPLHLALIVGNFPAVEVLLREGASVLLRDRHGNTALHLALKYPSLPCLQLVLRHKLVSRIVDALDFDGKTLYTACHSLVVLAEGQRCQPGRLSQPVAVQNANSCVFFFYFC